MKVLVIEDNTRLAERIKHSLGKMYVVDIVNTGEDGLAQVNAHDYNLIILDLGLPDMPGYKVCQQLRVNDLNAPILVLTANAEVDSKVQLFESGADDYLVKPFNAQELNARVTALIRRRDKPYTSEVLVVNDLEMNLANRRVKRSGRDIRLRRKEFDILEYLIHNRGRAVSREMILNHAWENGKESWNNTVDVHIKYLRDKIDRPFDYKLIKTAYGIGYMVEDA